MGAKRQYTTSGWSLFVDIHTYMDDHDRSIQVLARDSMDKNERKQGVSPDALGVVDDRHFLDAATFWRPLHAVRPRAFHIIPQTTRNTVSAAATDLCVRGGLMVRVSDLSHETAGRGSYLTREDRQILPSISIRGAAYLLLY